MPGKSLMSGFAIITAFTNVAAHAADDSSGLYVGTGVGEANNKSGEFDGTDTGRPTASDARHARIS